MIDLSFILFAVPREDSQIIRGFQVNSDQEIKPENMKMNLIVILRVSRHFFSKHDDLCPRRPDPSNIEAFRRWKRKQDNPDDYSSDDEFECKQN